MPLKPDDQYKGPSLVHVHAHCKLVKHRTMTTETFHLVDWLIDLDQVAVIDLGFVSIRPPKNDPGLKFRHEGRRVHFFLIGNHSSQVLTVQPTKRTRKIDGAVGELIEAIKAKWLAIIADGSQGS